MSRDGMPPATHALQKISLVQQPQLGGCWSLVSLAFLSVLLWHLLQRTRPSMLVLYQRSFALKHVQQVCGLLWQQTHLILNFQQKAASCFYLATSKSQLHCKVSHSDFMLMFSFFKFIFQMHCIYNIKQLTLVLNSFGWYILCKAVVNYATKYYPWLS